MKRALVLLLIIILCAAGYLSVWGYLPVVPVIGSGMEPAIPSGSLLVTRALEPSALAPGDVVVFSVPHLYQDNYGYPPVVARRIVAIYKDLPGWQLQTAADGAGNDPFLVKIPDVRGTISRQLPYLGLPLVFLQSRPGTYFVVFAVILLALFLYSGDIVIGLRRRYRDFISPIVEETHRVSLVLANRSEGTEKALESFAGAMQQYAHHMASHTSAIQGLSEASQALKNSALEQNQILYRLSHSLEAEKSQSEISRVERVVNELEKRTLLVLQVKDELEGKRPTPTYKLPERPPKTEPSPQPQQFSPQEPTLVEKEPPPAEMEIPPPEEIKSPPGCLGNPRALYARAHLFVKKPGLD
jgi:signal peptidase